MDITLPNCIIATILVTSLSVGAMLFIRKRVSLTILRAHHDVTDPLLAVLGTLFAILLGFMLANSMQRFEEARSNAQAEAGALGDLFRAADGLPADIRDKTRKDCLQYLDIVINEEWELMKNRTLSNRAWNVYGDLWHDCVHYEPQTQGQNNLHQLILNAMSKVGEARRARAAELTYSLPSSLWIVLVFGGLCTVVFTYFFAIDNIAMQVLMTGVITTIICLNVYMLAGYDGPFSGDIAISPGAFESIRDNLTAVDKKKLH